MNSMSLLLHHKELKSEYARAVAWLAFYVSKQLIIGIRYRLNRVGYDRHLYPKH